MQETENEKKVRQYYDTNTRWFFGLVPRSRPKTIHQSLYPTPQTTDDEAVHTQHHLILDLLRKKVEHGTVIDLGCGVGESMIYLAKQTEDITFHGITLSERQAKIGTKRIAKQLLSQRVEVIAGSFLALPVHFNQIDMAYAIESLIHADDASQFFEQAAKVLKPGGHLIVIDDFLLKKPDTKKTEKIAYLLKKGWLANSLYTTKELHGLARKAGFIYESHKDLSAMLWLNRPVDKLIRIISPVARLLMGASQYARFLVGGDARQRAYQYKMLEYAMLVFVKS
jgi:cyclopropane fatty-acyl-phospholipid synthase-like methyltransferase